ncbi:MAG: DUF86 domain-containing protein [Thermoplasmata archaeon]
MTGRRSDPIRLSDILRSVRRLEELLQSGYESFAASWLSQSAAIRELEIIGEAAGDMSATVRKLHPEIRWEQMRGFSSFAKHEYWRVNPELVWKAVVEMPSLKEKLARVVPTRESERTNRPNVA